VDFLISDTFAKSLSKLDSTHQKKAKQAAFEFQLNPKHPSFKYHRIERAKVTDFWSARVNSDIRLVIHQSDGQFILCYVAHHDDAYDWAERRRMEVHPNTGAAQLVELKSIVEEHRAPFVPNQESTESNLFSNQADDDLLALGVPRDWIDAVRSCDEDDLLELADKLPEEAVERLLTIATGGTVDPVDSASDNPFLHPDAQRRFKLSKDAEELQRALNASWDKWMLFLHPVQKKIAVRNYSGSARVTGSAGTGKTVVALHRAVHLSKSNNEAKILLVSYSKTLASLLQKKLDDLLEVEGVDGTNITVVNLHKLAWEYFCKINGTKGINLAKDSVIQNLLRDGQKKNSVSEFTLPQIVSEWRAIVDAWSAQSWLEYKAIPRTGRGMPLGAKQRKLLWSVFDHMKERLRSQNMRTWGDVFANVISGISGKEYLQFDHVIIDEVQDLGVPELKLVRALAIEGVNDLLLCGDMGQQIYQRNLSWKAVGIDIQGRSSRLKVNYRTTHQIKTFSDQLIPFQNKNGDGEVEDRFTVSMFEGADPLVRGFDTKGQEIDAVSKWIIDIISQGGLPHEIGIFTRTNKLIKNAQESVQKADQEYRELDDDMETEVGLVSVGTMHRAKGLEFKFVVVMACDQDTLPLMSVINSQSDPADIDDFIEQERHLLYVACTRAREHLLITYSGQPSEFIEPTTD
jgi:superfamily I DNA/RNA helicase/mRNA-degrading endonuclease RelE of RelBE toxin-antitoxin system